MKPANQIRSMNWGSTRAETIASDCGAVTLHAAEFDDLDQLAEAARTCVLTAVARFGIGETELAEELLRTEWLLGYAAGTCEALVAASGGTSDTALAGLTSRVCGELAGGGTSNKLAAFERLRECAAHPDFLLGRQDGKVRGARAVLP